MAVLGRGSRNGRQLETGAMQATKGGLTGVSAVLEEGETEQIT